MPRDIITEAIKEASDGIKEAMGELHELAGGSKPKPNVQDEIHKIVFGE